MFPVVNCLKLLRTSLFKRIQNSKHNLNNETFVLDLFDFKNHQSNLFRSMHTTFSNNTMKPRDRRDLVRGTRKKDEGTIGEITTVIGDANIETKEDMFTDVNTPNLLFNGVKFCDVPILSIYVTKNNTHFTLLDPRFTVITHRSCGMEGFKNCRKGTNVAAQAAGLTIAQKALVKGIKDVRIKVWGLGPGRMAGIKALQMGGLNIISITDDTGVPWRLKCKPRKIRRI